MRYVLWILLLCGGACAVSAPPEKSPAPGMAEGPDPRYWRYDRILERFEEWGRLHPSVFHRAAIGRTHRGEAIWAARISRDLETESPRPTLLFHAAQHANEANGTNAVMVMMERLLSGYGRDPEIAEMVDGLECWFVPVVNVDGHRIAFRGTSGWREWRKNGRDNDGDGVCAFGVDGVDLNRNWDHRWEEDPSVEPESRNYKGPRPFSEPEVVAVRDLILETHPVFVMDLHSPGKVTPGNRIFWPWYHQGPGRTGPDAAVYHAIARELAARTETEEDGVFYDGDGPSYDRLPKEQCWVYRETGICILLMEISKQFWWEGPIVDTIAERVADGCFHLLERALRGPGLAGRVTDAETGASLPAEVIVAELHDPGIGPRRADPRTGAFRRLLAPGTVTVIARADGYAETTRRVEISEGGWTEIFLTLVRERERGR